MYTLSALWCKLNAKIAFRMVECGGTLTETLSDSLLLIWFVLPYWHDLNVWTSVHSVRSNLNFFKNIANLYKCWVLLFWVGHLRADAFVTFLFNTCSLHSEELKMGRLQSYVSYSYSSQQAYLTTHDFIYSALTLIYETVLVFKQ